MLKGEAIDNSARGLSHCHRDGLVKWGPACSVAPSSQIIRRETRLLTRRVMGKVSEEAAIRTTGIGVYGRLEWRFANIDRKVGISFVDHLENLLKQLGS